MESQEILLTAAGFIETGARAGGARRQAFTRSVLSVGSYNASQGRVQSYAAIRLMAGKRP